MNQEQEKEIGLYEVSYVEMSYAEQKSYLSTGEPTLEKCHKTELISSTSPEGAIRFLQICIRNEEDGRHGFKEVVYRVDDDTLIIFPDGLDKLIEDGIFVNENLAFQFEKILFNFSAKLIKSPIDEERNE